MDLYSLKTKDEMNALFQEKGFRKKSNEEIKEETRIREVEEQLHREDHLQPMVSSLFGVYVCMGFMICVFGLFIQSRGKKQRRSMNLPVVRVHT